MRVEGRSKTRATERPARLVAPRRPPSRERVPPLFQVGGAVEQALELEGAQLFAGEEVSLQGADTTDDGDHRPLLEPLPRSRLPARREAAHLALAPPADRRANDTHVQVNRDLTPEFATLLSSAAWDVAMLQECPPRFAAPLARASGAEFHRVFTSRNELGFWRAALARQNPDLMASGEGGSNSTLVRVPGKLGGIAERRELAIHEGEPERRSMAFTRTASGVCVANLHATNDRPALAVGRRVQGSAGGERVGGRRAADLRRRPQPAPGGEPGGLRTPRERVRPRLADHRRRRRSTTSWSAVSRSSRRRPSGPPSAASCRSTGSALRLSDHAPIEARFARDDPPVLAN